MLDLATPSVDGPREVSYLYRSAWEIVCEMVQDPAMLKEWIWNYTPQYNNDGERVYGHFMSGRWVEAVYRDIKDPTVTVVCIVLGSDATQISKRKSAHPFYVSAGNLSTAMRMTRKGWKVAAFMPALPAKWLSQRTVKETEEQKRSARRQRTLLFNACAYHLLQDCKTIWTEGGRHVTDALGVMRKIVPVFCLYCADRQEHELVTMSYVHSCFHCNCPRMSRDNVRVLEGCVLKTQTSVQNKVLEAMEQGRYGEQDEWQLQCKRLCPRPFMRVDDNGDTVVTRWAAYQHCASVLETYPEINLLWDIPFSDIMQQCRDDPLHMISLGLIPHIMTAILSKYIRHLHPPWSVQSQHAPGMSGMMTVCNRLKLRLRNTGVPLLPFVQSSFERVLAGTKQPGNWIAKWGLTGSESVRLFGLLPFCVPDLVTEEVQQLNSLRPKNEIAVSDPSRDIVLVVGKTLAWYQAAKAVFLSESDVVSLHEQGEQLMQLIMDVLPSRDVSIPKCPVPSEVPRECDSLPDSDEAGSESGSESAVHQTDSDSGF